jgi:hypothetical protein
MRLVGAHGKVIRKKLEVIKAVSVTAALLALVCSAVANAAIAPVDAASDHAAILAYHRYLSTSTAPSRSAADAFVSSVAGSCPNVLAAVNLLPPNVVNKGAVVAFGEEVGGDLLAAAAYPPSRGPFAKLARALSRLRWSSGQTSETITRYTTSVGRSLRLRPSDLCDDAKALAASNAQVTPPGTLNWLASFGRNGTAAQNSTKAFLAVLGRYETPADASLINANNRLVKHAESALKSLLTTEVPKLLSALGLSE